LIARQSKAVTDKLNEPQKNHGAATPLQKSLKDAIAQVSQALSQGDHSRFKDGVDGDWLVSAKSRGSERSFQTCFVSYASA